MAKRKKAQKKKLFSNARDSFKVGDTAVFDVFTDFAILIIIFIAFILIFVAALL